MMRHILVGVDGSEASRGAALFAHDLAQQTGARLTLLYVLRLPEIIPVAPFAGPLVVHGKPTPDQERQALALLDRVAADLPKAQVNKALELGAPAAVLCEQARALGVDLLVVGARGLGAVPHLLLGSVSHRVVQHAPCPVTVVPER